MKKQLNPITFSNIVGYEKEKEELKKIKNFILNPKQYEEIGAKVPKGILLVGPSGNGKTLMVKALFSELKIPVYSIGDEDSTAGDLIHSEEIINPLEYTINEEYKRVVDKCLKTLNPKEEKVIRLRFGFVNDEILTLENVGKELGITRERVRQIEVKALRKLHDKHELKNLKEYKI